MAGDVRTTMHSRMSCTRLVHGAGSAGKARCTGTDATWARGSLSGESGKR